MSLLSIIESATQTLLNSQTQISVVSNNIGNAQDPNYVKRNTSVVQSGDGGGVVDVSRAIDSSLQQEVFSQTSASTGQSYLNEIYQQLEQLDGSASGTPSLSSAAQALVTAFQAFAAQPESQTTQASVLQAANGLVSAVHTIASGIESIAGQVQSQAQSDVSTLNGDLSTINSLNGQIVADKAAGKSTADLEDQRDAAVADVARLVPVRTTLNADGSLRVATPDGVALVDKTATQFVYTPFTPGANGTAGTNASISVADQPGVSLNGSFSSGKISAELGILRVDDAGAASTDPSVAPLEKMRRQLDAFADQFYSSDSATPTAFQAAYNNAPTGSGELASDLFVVQNQGPGGQPQPAAGDRMGFEVNPQLTSGAATLKQGAANTVLQALTQPSSSSAITAGDVQNFTGTITDLANSISSAQTQRSVSVQNSSQDSAAVLSATQAAYSNGTGVSMDDQLSELLVLQNSYNAAAKLVSVANSLAQTLLQAVGP